MAESAAANATAVEGAGGETGLYIAYTAILVMAFVPIYIGSFRSLRSAATVSFFD